MPYRRYDNAIAYIPGLLTHNSVDRGKGRGGAEAEQKSKDRSKGCHLDDYFLECNGVRSQRQEQRTQHEARRSAKGIVKLRDVG
jgi:hypothetical protein